MQEKLEEIMGLVQDLDIKPTMANVEKLLQIEYGLIDIYKAINEREGTDDGREQTDPEGRDSN